MRVILRFVLKCILFIFLFFAIDFILASVIQQLRPSEYKQFIESKNDFNEKSTDIDVLIIGDSHISDAINPRVIEENCSFASYNFGVYHNSPYECYWLLKYILNQTECAPKYLLIGTNPAMFTQKVSTGRYTSIFIKSPIYRFFLYWNAEQKDFTIFSNFVRESYLIKPIIKQLFGGEILEQRIIKSTYNGYLENTRTSNLPADFVYNGEDKGKVEQGQIDYFSKVIRLAKSYNIRPVLINPPILHRYKNNYAKHSSFMLSDSILEEFSKAYSIEIVNKDYAMLKDCDSTYFLNAEHLNNKGARIFSGAVANKLNEIRGQLESQK